MTLPPNSARFRTGLSFASSPPILATPHWMNKELQISTGVVKNASGSAYVELGNMKILCSVQGPRDSYLSDGFNDRGKLFCDFKYAPFSIKGVYKEMTQVCPFPPSHHRRTEKSDPSPLSSNALSFPAWMWTPSPSLWWKYTLWPSRSTEVILWSLHHFQIRSVSRPCAPLWHWRTRVFASSACSDAAASLVLVLPFILECHARQHHDRQPVVRGT